MEELKAPIDEIYYRNYPTLPFNPTYSGDGIIRVLNQAWAYIKRMTNNCLDKTTIDETLDHSTYFCNTRAGMLFINPRQTPCISLESVTVIYSDGTTKELDITKAIKRQNGYIIPNSPLEIYDIAQVNIEYVAGYETIPEDLKYVCAMVTSHIMSGAFFPADGSVGEGSLLPQWLPAECKTILQKYTRHF